MASWSDLAKSNLEAAKLLMRESQFRSCLNRAYYSAYAAATDELARTGVSVASAERPNPSHDQLLKLVRSNLPERRFSDRTRQELTGRLKRLRTFREMADYEPDSSVDKTEALQALTWASECQRRLQEGDHGAG